DLYTDANDLEDTMKIAEESGEQMNFNDMLEKSRKRIQTLRNMNSLKRVDANNLDSLEREPAYMRRNVELDQVPHSSEQTISRYTLNNSEEKRPEIRPNNSFLRDNVD